MTGARPFSLLALEGGGEGVSFALFAGETCVAHITEPAAEAASLPALLAPHLAGKRADAIAVLVGPGRFTGLRATLAVAEGLALGWNAPLFGLSVGDVIATLALPEPGPLWVVTPDGRGGVFVESEGELTRFGPEALPLPPEGTRLAGAGAELILAHAGRAGVSCIRLSWHGVRATALGEAALQRQRQRRPFRPPQPLYVGTVAFRPRPGWTPTPVGEEAPGHG